LICSQIAQLLFFAFIRVPSHSESATVFAVFYLVTGQFVDQPTRGQSSHGLINFWTGQSVDESNCQQRIKKLTFIAIIYSIKHFSKLSAS